MISNRILRNIWRLSHRGLQLSAATSRNPAFHARVSSTPGVKVGPYLFGCSQNFSTKTAVNLSEKEKGIEEYLDKLKTSQTATGRVNFGVLTKAVESLDGALSEAQAEFLLDCCAHSLPSQSRETKLEIFRRTWNHLKENNLVTERLRLVGLKVLQANRAPASVFQDFLEECRVKGNSEIYEALIWFFSTIGDIGQAKEILDEMRSKNLPLTATIFNALILGHARKMELEGIKSVLDSMSATDIEQTPETYSLLARSYIENGEIKKAEAILLERQSSFNTEQIVAVITAAAEANLESLVSQCVKLLPKDLLNMKEIPPALRNVCTELTYLGHPGKAFLIVNAFPKPIFGENQDRDSFGATYINDLVRSNQPVHEVVEFCKKLISSEKNERALHLACEAAVRSNSEDVLNYFKALSKVEKLRPHYFWALLIRNFKTSGEVGVLNTLKEMSRLETEPDYETLINHVLPKLSITLQDEQKAVKILEDCGFKTSQFMTPLIAHLMYQQKSDEVVALCSLYQTKLDTQILVYPLVNLTASIKATGRYRKLGKILNALDTKSQNPSYDFIGEYLVEIISNSKFNDNNDLLKKILQELQRHNLKMSSTAYEILSSHLYKNENDAKDDSLQKSFRQLINKSLNLPAAVFAGSHITHPRDMNLEQLECHLVELESKGLNTRGVLRRLLQVCVREGQLERAFEIKQKCDELKVNISPGMMASTFDMYIKLKKLTEAKTCLFQIKKSFPGFLIDEHKMIDFAALLIENNRFNDAKEVLMSRASTTKVIGGDYINKNLWNLLTTCAKVAAAEASPDMPNQTKELFKLVQDLKYCRPSNVLLGPIIKEYILRKKVKDAVAEYIECSEKYRNTPLQFEVMSLLVSLSNEEGIEEYEISPTEARELLHKVIEASAKVHGSANTNSTLVLAVANSGSETQLRKLLINPEIRLNPDSLIRNVEHLSSGGRIDMILKLARAGRGMGHAVKETELYKILLNTFIKENNCTAAQALFEKLEADDDCKITQDFLKTLVDLFRANNLDIPANIALRARATL